MPQLTFDNVYSRILETSENKKQQGTAFEHATLYFLKNDPMWSSRLSDVWLWADSPTKDGQDIGIDLVAYDALDGSYWAIQCKCFQEDAQLSYKQLGTFFSTANTDPRYKHFMIVDTVNSWTSHLQEIANKYHTVRVDMDALREAEIDWTPFLEGKPLADREIYEPREHQIKAIQACLKGFETADRGKLVMACGTGKTLTALRLSEEYCPNGLVLFLAPSISLISQTLRSWANQSKNQLNPFVVCSDSKASKLQDVWETSVSEIPYPATTDVDELVQQVSKVKNTDGLTVIFSTYQSIQVVIDAQRKGLGEFDLCICDEAHRTTGVRDLGESKEDQSAFTKVHDANTLKADKRLYMTATPRVYGTQAKKKAHEENYEVSSMDDVATYGEEFYRLSFGQAVEKGLLSDYRVLVLTVSEAMASQVYQQSMSDEEGGFDVPEAAKILGCWKGLATRGKQVKDLNLYRADMDFSGEKLGDFEIEEILPMKRAVAFSSTIKESERFKDYFQEVVNLYIEKSGIEYPLTVETDHVDGGMDSTTRKNKLHWLEEEPPQDTCRVLSNAKCLSEGIDVPSLDAVLFMKPRKSQVDIIQAVGRVMRKAPGKKYGYIILPVVVPAGMTPEEALDDDKAFAVVWQILQALRSHDERLDARINSLIFKGDGEGGSETVIVDNMDDDGDTGLAHGVQEKLALEWTVEDWQNAMEAKLVKKCGTRVYWEDWADDVAGIAQRHISRIQNIIDTDGEARKEFDRFLVGLRDSLNPGISENQAVEMLAQHLITLPVFEALFGDESFVQSNPVSIAMEGMLDVLRSHAIEKREDDEVLEDLYASVRSRISVVQSAAGRQAIIKELYEGFFSKAFKGTSEKMGIVYTPNEIVEYILRATDRTLKQEFGQGLGDPGVHILDPFAGTGTFMADLITSDLISDEQLPYKYQHELHSNEILLLAYYIMTINIEQAYMSRMGGDYVPFEGAVLTDTFQMTEEGDTLDTEVFTQNSDRVVAQNKLDIRVIVGNPPYSAGQKSANDNNANDSYPFLDARIRELYVKGSRATLNNAVYNSYVKAFRWASDRIGDRGLICFVSCSGWLRGLAFDVFRNCILEEFSSIYVFDLRGNKDYMSLTKDELDQEGENVFKNESKSPIAITMLVKNPSKKTDRKAFYYDIGKNLKTEEKLAIIKGFAEHPVENWVSIAPDKYGDWFNKREDSFYDFAPMGVSKFKLPSGIFSVWSNGVKTQRDPWAYSFSVNKLENNMLNHINFYQSELERYKESLCDIPIEEFINYDPTKGNWTRALRGSLKSGKQITFNAEKIRKALYRPFCIEYLYFDKDMNEIPAQQAKLFPGEEHRNVLICSSDKGPFITNMTPDLECMRHGQYFPLFWYEKEESLGGLFEEAISKYIRHDAITDEALSVFRGVYPEAFDVHGKRPARAKKYGGVELNKEDIFFYIYGVLHSPEYRTRFASNLKKELPRIPLAEDFVRFCNAGRALAELHLNYENVEPYPSIIEEGNSEEPGRTEKMRFGKCKKDDDHPKGEDKTVLRVAENLVLRNIPERAYDYVVNGKSAISWLMDRYQVRTDKSSGIVNDPNDYSDDPRYIVDLVKRVVTVSMETLEIVGNLPPLNEKPQPANWPFAWKVDKGN
jgi:predicted helicase